MEILITEQEIHERVQALGEEINRDYAGERVLIVGVLTGCLIFLSDLIRQLNMPVEIALLQASSYRGSATSPGELRWKADSLPDLTDTHVLIVDDIFDTGHTLHAIANEIQSRGVKSKKSCVLLWKTERTVVADQPDYVGFEIPDRFVIGYGLDYDGQYRQLPHIAVFDENQPPA